MVALIVINKELKDTCEYLVNQLYQNSVGESFTIKLYSDDMNNITNYAMTPICSDEIIAQLEGMKNLEQFVGKVSVEYCEVDVVYQSFQDFLSRLNLNIYQEPMGI